MLKNYLKITLRNLLRNKVFVAINVVGLGLALACCIIAYLNYRFNADFDQCHAQIDHIYKIHSQRDDKGEIKEYGRIPMPMADRIRIDLPGIKHVFRYESHVFTVRDVNMDKVLSSSVCYADPGFMESFTFPLVSGDPLAYHKLEKAVVTQTYAAKFYGNEDPIGKVLTIFDDTGMSFNFEIAGVVEEAPQNSSLNFEILIAFDNRYRMYDDNVKDNWKAFAQNTFVYLNDPSQVPGFEPLLNKYLPLQTEARPDFSLSNFVLSPMNNHAQIARDIRWDNLRNAGPKAAVITPAVMAILILLVACFNFTNTAIATSNKRLKEIGLRKVMGGKRRQLIFQFMTENLTICLLALIISIGIAYFLVPAYSAMWEGMDLQLSLTEDFKFYLFLLVLLGFTTLLAGFYPSLYISNYQPVKILRGSLSIGGAGRLTKFLLGAQYTFTVIAMFASIAFIQNARYQDTLDLGYERDQIIGVSLLNEKQYQNTYASMLANPNVKAIASARNHIGRGDYSATIKHQELEIETNMMDVGLDYIETMGLTIIDGRSFTKSLEATDTRKSLIVNEKFVEAMGWTEAIGQIVNINDTTSLNVVGVVKNFYMNGFWEPIEPTALRLQKLRFLDDGSYRFIVAKVELDKTEEVYEYLEAEWNQKIPTKTFAGFYQDDLLRGAREVNNNILTIFGFLCTVAFVLSCLGLFTMVSINLIRRMKEIGVRKVLGGTVQNIIALINRRYFFLLLISSVLGIGLGYFLIDNLIASIYTYYKPMDFYTFAIPVITILAVSLTITSLRTLKSAIANPVNSLRYE